MSLLPDSTNLVQNYFIEEHRWRLWKDVLDKLDREQELE
jgi:hypothetical protein